MTGFGKLNNPVSDATDNKLDLSGFSGPLAAPRELSIEEERLADRVSERRGIPGEAVGRVQLNRNRVVSDRLFIQGPIEVLNQFRTLCNEKGVPLYKGLEMLLAYYSGS